MSCSSCGGQCYRQGPLWVCANCGATYSAGYTLLTTLMRRLFASQIFEVSK